MKRLSLIVAFGVVTCFSSTVFAATPTVVGCTADVMGSAKPGTICLASSTKWEVSLSTYQGQRVYVDLASGLKLTGFLPAGATDYFTATTWCTGGYRLPSQTEIQKLYADGIRNVVPGLMAQSSFAPGENQPLFDSYAWLNTPSAPGSDDCGDDNDSGCASDFDALTGEINDSNIDDTATLNVICVSGT